TGNQAVALDCDLSDDCELILQVSPPLAVGMEETIIYNNATSDIGRIFGVHWVVAFSEERAPYNSSKTFYAARWDTQANTKGAQSDLLIGGRPTVSLRGTPSLEKKYTISHEYGHLQTLVTVIPGALNHTHLDYCYPQNCALADDIGTLLNHTFDSVEWQSAAAAEGFAHFYAMSVWNDLAGGVGVLADPGETDLDIIAHRTDDMAVSL